MKIAHVVTDTNVGLLVFTTLVLNSPLKSSTKVTGFCFCIKLYQTNGKYKRTGKKFLMKQIN